MALSENFGAGSPDRAVVPAAPLMGDLYPYETSHGLIEALSDANDPQVLQLRWSDGREQAFHALWLREQCPCGSCRHPASLERVLDQESYSLDLVPARVTVGADGGLSVIWDGDGHVSRYGAGWLRHRGQPPIELPARQSWDAGLAG
jgi:gamma-butyrobetaine dioxygenase